ncbi:ABC transporter substrate-binding protein [Vagococcus carniphilus]|uniref:ABC transporter substrate-binding protein n=1 Tax=Vagococcus carniphilus TaxID=218144 RepID=UPI003B5B63F5
MYKKLLVSLSLIVTCFIISGCHETTKADQSKDGYSFETLNLEGKKVEQHVKKSPNKVLVIGEKNAERLIYFGLEEKIDKLAYLESVNNKKIKGISVLAKEWPSKEAVVKAKPDLIYGISTAFQKDRLGDFNFWNEQGIAIGTTSNYKNGISLDNYFLEIEELGHIFNMNQKTDRFIKEQKESIKKVTDQKKKVGRESILFVASDGRGNYYYYPDEYSLVDEVVRELDGNYLDLGEEVVNLSYESLIKINPEKIIFTSFMASEGGKDSLKWLEHDSLKNVAAIKNKEILEMNYDDVIRGNENISNVYQEIYDFLKVESKEK